jgi:hypothetical protein
MYGYDFHRQNRLTIILDFLLRIDAWDWSRWLFSWIFEVYEKDRVKENRMNELGITVWDSWTGF